MTIYYIYLLTYGDGKMYVGKHTYARAKNVHDYCTWYYGSGMEVKYFPKVGNEDAKNYDPHFTGVKPEKTILEWCNKDNLHDREVYWIQQYVDQYGFSKDGGLMLNRVVNDSNGESLSSEDAKLNARSAKISKYGTLAVGIDKAQKAAMTPEARAKAMLTQKIKGNHAKMSSKVWNASAELRKLKSRKVLCPDGVIRTQPEMVNEYGTKGVHFINRAYHSEDGCFTIKYGEHKGWTFKTV